MSATGDVITLTFDLSGAWTLTGVPDLDEFVAVADHFNVNGLRALGEKLAAMRR